MGEYWRRQSWKIKTQEDLPFLPTPFDVIEAIFNFLKLKNLIRKSQKFVDLGAGDGRVIVYATEHYGCSSLGIEINLELIESAKSLIKRKKLGHICKIIEADCFHYDISQMDIIFCFFLPSNYKYCHHIFKMIKSGAIIINIKHSLKIFNKYWSKSFQILESKQFPAYLYIKK